MSETVMPASRMERWRRPLLAICAARFVIPIVALIPFGAFLATLPEPSVGTTELLTLARPGKEMLLIGGGVERINGMINLPLLFAAYIPGMIIAVWAFFALGRAYAADLDAGEGPQWLARMVPPERLDQARRVIAKRGVTVAIFGRVAALPPTIMAVAAGTTSVDAKRYLAADLVGAVASFAITVGAGYALGAAYQSGGRIFLVVGLLVFFGGAQLFTRWLDEEAEDEGPPLDTEPRDILTADD